MSNPIPVNSRRKVEPSLKDLFDIASKDILLKLNCHAIAIIQSFDPENQTISGAVAYKKSFDERQADGTYKIVLKDYPPLIDVPVVIMSGGPWSLTFPINQGDECLILFNDRDLDNWFQSGQVGGVASGRLHSFSDGIALVGLRSTARSLPDYDTTRAVLGNSNGTMVGVGDSLIKIANATTSLNALLQELITDVNNLVTATAAITVTGVGTGIGTSGPPANAAAITAVATQLSTTASKIAGLLE